MRRLFCLGLSGFLAGLVFAGENPVLENARLHAGDFNANRLAGEYLLARKDLPGAILYLEKAWKIDPVNYANGYDLALAYLEIGKKQKSHDVIDALIKQGDKAELHNLLADVEESEGLVNEAAHQYELATRLDASEKNVFDLGSDLLKHRGFSAALTVFRFGVERYATSARIRVGLGIAYYSLGQFDEAVPVLCEAVDLDPRDTKALDFLGKMVGISPQYASEITTRLARFANTYPDNSAANYYYALSLRQQNLNTDDKAGQQGAEAHLIKAVTLKPDFPDAHYQLGLLYEDEARETEAIHQYALAAKYQPTLVKAHYHLARLYQRAGQEALAKREFQVLKTLKGSQ
jgi:tetratricopeptide (TPR) repeat protein